MQRWEYTILDFTKPRTDLDELNQALSDTFGMK